jgi:dienelactone hydrolase
MMRFFGFLLLAVVSVAASEPIHFETSVTPLTNEDIAAPCPSGLTIAAPERPIRAVWVIYDRGRDVHDLYADAAVVDFARRFQLALLLHGHCPGKKPEDHGDMNMNPSNGLGRALFTALDQFAKISGHSELASAKVILLGFSGAGSLCARMVNIAPDRVVAAILSAPGHYEPFGIDTVSLTADALAVPELIIAGGRDDVSGTVRPYSYFEKYRGLGAPWAFVLQNNSPHCCTANSKDLILDWLKATIEQRKPSSSSNDLTRMDQSHGWLGFIRTQAVDTKDSFGLRTFNVVGALIEKSKKGQPTGWMGAGWLPNHQVALDWLAFVKQPEHPVLPVR